MNEKVHIWLVTDGEYWIGAGTAEDIRQAYNEQTGADCINPVTGFPDYPIMLTEKDLDRLRIELVDQDGEPTGDTCTFRQAFNERVEMGLETPEFFAAFELP